MNLDQIAGELRQMPDAALQQQANAPGAVPGYLVADEIQRRIQARKAPQQQGNGQGKPTILSILANNLAAPQSPVTRPQPQVPFPPVPQNNLAAQSTMPQHLDTGGGVKTFDPSSLYSDVPVGAGSGSAGDVQTGDLATMDAPGPMPATPSRNVPAWSETVPNGVGGNSAGAYQPPVTKYPETSTSPIQDPPNTHKGGRGFIETLTSLAPAMQYLGNIGAAAARPGGNFASGVGYANEQMQAQQNEKAKQDMLRQEMAMRSQNMALESQKVQQGALMSGAKFVGPNGEVQEPPVNAPASNINGVPMGGGQIAGSGNVPMNPQMTQMTGLPQYGGQKMDYSDILTEQKRMQLAQQNEYAKQANQAALNVASKQAEMVPVPAELATHGFTPNQMVYPATLDKLLEMTNPKEPDKPLGVDRVSQINAGNQVLWTQMGNAGPMDPSLVLPKTATIGDYSRLDAILNKVVQGAATQQQRDLGNQMRQQALMQSAQAHQDAMALASNRQDVQLQEAGAKAYAPAMDASKRFNVMSQNYLDGLKGDQQAQLSLLANHLGMTLGDIKGGRVNQAYIQDAINSRPWLQGMGAKFDDRGILSGVTLSKPQMQQMLNLGREKYVDALNTSHSNASYIGVHDGGPTRVPNDATKRYYGDLAGGNQQKAKELAAADGWTVQ